MVIFSLVSILRVVKPREHAIEFDSKLFWSIGFMLVSGITCAVVVSYELNLII